MNLSKFQTDGKFLMLALDHRGSFKKLMNSENPDGVSDEEVIELKKEIIESLENQFSGLLIDETYGLEAYPNHIKPFLLPVEKSGYTNQEGERITELEYRVTQLVVYGASGAKMLLYFNPDVESADKQIKTAKQVITECQQNSFPLFLEPVTYLVNGDSHTQDPDLVLRSVGMLVGNGVVPKVFKLEYPGNLETCYKITELLRGTPWILLTNPDSFEQFVEHLKDAIKAGARGFLAGRALWQEVCTLQGEEKQKFLQETLPKRFSILTQIC